MSLFSNITLLRYLASHNPRLWEIVHPHVPLVSEGVKNVLTATILKSIAADITDATISSDLHKLGRSFFEAGIKSMTYENTAWSPDAGVMLNPQPLPPARPENSGALLALLADSVTSPNMKPAAESIRRIGNALIKA